MATVYRPLTQQAHTSTRISFRGAASTREIAYEEVTSQSNINKLKGALLQAMADVFLTYPFNVERLMEVLKCIKYSKTFNLQCVRQEFNSDSYSYPCKMLIKFKHQNGVIQVKISEDRFFKLDSESAASNPKQKQLIELIRYIQEEYADL